MIVLVSSPQLYYRAHGRGESQSGAAEAAEQES